MRTAVLIAEMIAAVAGLLALMALLFYGLAWTALFAVRLMPLIGKRHRHNRWGFQAKRSATTGGFRQDSEG